MKEFKTLKELHEEYTKENEITHEGMELIEIEHDRQHFVDDLKAEAAEWVKIWLNEFKDKKKDNYFLAGLAARISFFKLFFNLTEEDLK